jgi:hypothetical protein
MLRAFSIVACAVLLATGLAFAGSPHAGAAVPGSDDDGRLTHAYAQIRIGMPISRLTALGFGSKELLSRV